MNKSSKPLITQLNEADKKMLIKLYQLRCLSVQQIFDLYYRSIIDFNAFVKKNLTKMVQLNLIKLSHYQEDGFGVTLENGGVQIVRELLNLPPNTFTKDKRIVQRGYLRASDLKILPRFMNHQVHLNDFILKFEDQFKEKYPHHQYKYSDEKHLSQYLSIRPDGLLQLFDVDLFLEMDMGTETKKALEQKWRHYRQFITNKNFQYQERRMIIFMFCEGGVDVQARRELVLKTAFETLGDYFSNQLDMYVGSIEELTFLLFEKLIPHWLQEDPTLPTWQRLFKSKGFKLYHASQFNHFLSKGHYQLYAQLPLKTATGDVLIKDFFLDDWRAQRLAICTNIAFFYQNRRHLEKVFDRPLNYLICANTEDQCLELLKILGLLNEKNVYFTTIERLNKLPLERAIFSFDFEGNRYHYQSLNLDKKRIDH